jgi:protein-tyrosine phosphatase
MHFKKLLDLGFDADVDLELERQEKPEDVKIYLWLPVKDQTAPTLDQLKAGVALIDQMVKDGKKIYVHCMNGHGRAPTLVAAYFISKNKMNVDQAVDIIRKKRPEIHLEEVQKERLMEYQMHINKKMY